MAASAQRSGSLRPVALEWWASAVSSMARPIRVGVTPSAVATLRARWSRSAATPAAWSRSAVARAAAARSAMAASASSPAWQSAITNLVSSTPAISASPLATASRASSGRPSQVATPASSDSAGEMTWGSGAFCRESSAVTMSVRAAARSPRHSRISARARAR